MVAQQRQAVFDLCLVVTVLVVFASLVPICGPTRAQGAFGLLCLLAVGPLFYRRRGAASVCDERDQLVRVRALQITMGTLFCGAVSLPWALYLQHHGTGTVTFPVRILPEIAWSGWIWFEACQAVSTLLLYRWL